MSEILTPAETIGVLCAECGEPLTCEEIEYPSEHGLICTGCECAGYHWRCDFCEECEDEDYDVEIFAVFDADAAGIPVGMYRILSRPFYVQAMIGPGWIWPDCVERIADLPADQEEPIAPCSMLCQRCAAVYLKVAAETPTAEVAHV